MGSPAHVTGESMDKVSIPYTVGVPSVLPTQLLTELTTIATTLTLLMKQLAAAK